VIVNLVESRGGIQAVHAFRREPRNQEIFEDIADRVPFDRLVYTGPIDAYFGHAYGRLPYRSLDFAFETHDRDRFQNAAVVNYPGPEAFTRITEFKYLTGQQHPKTTIAREYPTSVGDPDYPIPRAENPALSAMSAARAARALQGVGGALILSTSVAILSNAVPEAQRRQQIAGLREKFERKAG